MNKDIILLDANIIIYALKGEPRISDFINNKRAAVSFVTEIELLGWKNISTQNKSAIELFLNDCLFIEYNLRIKQTTINLKSKYGLKLGDSFVAASAVEFDLVLVSADKIFSKGKDFFLTLFQFINHE